MHIDNVGKIGRRPVMIDYGFGQYTRKEIEEKQAERAKMLLPNEK